MTQILVILATALLSTACTLGAVYLLFKIRWQRELEEAYEEKLRQLQGELGDMIEARVRQGVVKGVAAIPTKEVLRDTTRNVARTGAELLEEGLASLLSGGRRGKPR